MSNQNQNQQKPAPDQQKQNQGQKSEADRKAEIKKGAEEDMPKGEGNENTGYSGGT